MRVWDTEALLSWGGQTRSGKEPLVPSRRPELTEAQKRAVEAACRNAVTAVKGAAGSGKTLVAAEIAERLTSERDLFSATERSGAVAVVTYTNALTKYTEGLVSAGIRVSTVHALLRDFLEGNGRKVRFPQKGAKRNFLETNLDKARFAVDFVEEEFSYLLGRGLKDREAYLKARRSGRGRALQSGERNYIFDLFERYLQHLDSQERIDFDDVGNAVLALCARRGEITSMVKHLIIDEVQDLPITWIQALRKTASGKIVYIGDTAQSIYGKQFTWKESIGQTVKPIELKSNFRNTQQIFEAADSILKFEYELNDGAAAEASQAGVATRQHGRRPQVFFCKSAEHEKLDVLRKALELCESPGEGAICIGYRGMCANVGKVLDYVEEKLEGRGFSVRRHSDEGGGKPARVHISTMHSMKGLEFDHVLLVGLNDAEFFREGQEEDEETERRLVFVAMTRAKRTLSLFASSDKPLRFISEIAPSKILPVVWNPVGYENAYRDQIGRIDQSRIVLRERFADQNARIADLESEIERLEGEHSESRQRLDSLLSEKDERVLDLQSELQKAVERQKELEGKLRYFSEQEASTRSRLDPVDGAAEVREHRFRKDAKILLLGGDGGIKDKEVQGIFKELGLPKDAYERVEYDRVANFDINRCMDSLAYSDIFIGTTPHKAKGIGGASSLLQYLRNNADSFPRLTVFENEDGTLTQFSKSKFKQQVRNSALYASVHGL